MRTTVALIVCTLALAGCATTKGLQLDPGDEQECAEVGCTVWSDRQLLGLIRQAFEKGFAAGAKKERGAI